MNILFLVPYTPTLIRTRPYNLVRGLARRGHAVTLATLWENESERAALTQLERAGIRVVSTRLTKPRAFWNMLRALPSRIPLQAAYCWQPEFLRNTQHAIRNSQFDVIHVEHLRGAKYALWLQNVLRNTQHASRTTDYGLRIPVVWDSVDCISHLFEQAARHSRSPFGRFVTRLELARTRRYEAMLVDRFDRVLVTSPIDAAALTELASRNTQHAICNTHHAIDVLPNGVDLEYFTPSPAPRDPDTIVFTGKMSYHANVTAALFLVNDIMPLIWRERPGVRLQIVGKDPQSQVRNLAIRAPQSSICVTGAVPDIPPYLWQAQVAVVPIVYGAGSQFKVLEAMACGTPVVATPQAVSALQVTDGEHLLVGDGAAAFARQTLRLLQDAELRRRIGTAGRQFVECNHDWNKIVERLEEIYQQLSDRPVA